ncbi:MAG: hypothetical protein WDW38_000834 [Sanguina aurantia]
MASLQTSDPAPPATPFQRLQEIEHVGQQLVQAGLQQPPTDRNFEANPYHALARSHLAGEKLAAVLLHLSDAQTTMQRAGLWHPQQTALADRAAPAAPVIEDPMPQQQ